MSKSIRTIYRNGQIELPPEIQLPDNTYGTVILPDDLPEDAALDPAFSIPDLAQDNRTRGSLPQLGTLPLRPSKTMNSSSTNLVYVDAAGWIALVNRRDALHTEAERIYEQRLQEQCQFITASVVLLEVGNWGMIDCISFVIMQERNLTEALTSDHHFEQAGFKVLL